MSVAAIAEGRRPSAASAALLPTALADLRADFDELLSLCRGAEAKLAETAVELDSAGLREPTRRLLLGELEA
ncbi:MAG: hypothetical protein M3229_01740, partial [Actinomycetota bacterium]|nr:hypothetical protein [Actinomycetota bacterium]